LLFDMLNRYKTEETTRNRQSRDNIGHKTKGRRTNHKKTHRKVTDEHHEAHQKPGWTQMLSKGEKFLFLIIHPQCYSYSYILQKSCQW
jgi:hypothetical protein